MDSQTSQASPATITIEPVCGNCIHWLKNPQEIGQGVCIALPPSCSFKGAALVKCRPNMGANERGCTALFMPRPELVTLAEASAQGAVIPGG